MKNKDKGVSKINILLAISIMSFLGMIGLFYLHFNDTAKLAFVDSKKLINNYQGMVDARTQFRQKASSWQSNIDTLAKELEGTIKKYEASIANLSAKEKTLSQELIKTKRQQLVDYERAIQQQSQQEDAALTQQVFKQVNAYLEEYGKRRNYNIILAATEMGNIAYANEGIDITDDVLEGLNDEYNGN